MTADDLIGTREAAEILACSSKAVSHLVTAGRLACTRNSNGDRQYSRNEVEKLARRRGVDVYEYQPVERRPSGRMVRLDCPPHVNPDHYVAALTGRADDYA